MAHLGRVAPCADGRADAGRRRPRSSSPSVPKVAGATPRWPRSSRGARTVVGLGPSVLRTEHAAAAAGRAVLACRHAAVGTDPRASPWLAPGMAASRRGARDRSVATFARSRTRWDDERDGGSDHGADGCRTRASARRAAPTRPSAAGSVAARRRARSRTASSRPRARRLRAGRTGRVDHAAAHARGAFFRVPGRRTAARPTDGPDAARRADDESGCHRPRRARPAPRRTNPCSRATPTRSASRRGDYNGQVLTVRAADIETLAAVMDTTAEPLRARLAAAGSCADAGGPDRRALGQYPARSPRSRPEPEPIRDNRHRRRRRSPRPATRRRRRQGPRPR